MGSRPTKPVTDLSCYVATGNNLLGGLAAMQGWRPSMEDEHVLLTEIPDLPNISIFAIFDGHGGGEVSKYLAENIVIRLVASGLNEDMDLEEIKQLIYECFLTLDDELLLGNCKSGSTGVLCLFTKTHIIAANVGDSRGIICSNKEVTALSQDHKPWHESEKQRIIDAGGEVLNKRVNGELAVSRSFGDIRFKQNTNLQYYEQLVIAVPDFMMYERRPGDSFVVLGCDGIWDVLSNDIVCNIINNELDVTHDPGKLASILLNRAFQLGSQDNISAMVILINNENKFSFDITKSQNMNRIKSNGSGLKITSHNNSSYNIKLVNVADICF